MGKANGALPYINWDAYKRPDSGGTDLDEALDRARDAYSHGVDAMLERIAEEFPMPELAQYPVQDFALFAIFLASAKMVELAGQTPDRRQLLSAFNYLLKRAEREVPEKILELAKALAAPEAGHA